MTQSKKTNPLSTSAHNNITAVRVSGSVFRVNSPGSVEKVETQKSIDTLRKALKEGVFSDLINNEPENK